jgi:hypothetical protein
LPQFLQTLRHRVGTVIVKSESIDKRTVLWVTKNPRARVSRLCLGGHGPDLDEAKPECFPGRNGNAVFVETCRQPDRISEFQAED